MHCHEDVRTEIKSEDKPTDGEINNQIRIRTPNGRNNEVTAMSGTERTISAEF